MDPAIESHYGTGYERARLFPGGTPALEFVRSLELLDRLLPAPPARVLDVGGGPGAYAAPLARRGYRVHLVDAMPLHVEQAREVAGSDPAAAFTAVLGDARDLPEAAGSQDAVLLFGPLYHLTEAEHRRQALGEAWRILRPGGRLLAVAISRFASLLDGVYQDWLDDPQFRRIVDAGLADGKHRNPEPVGRPERFTTAYFHTPTAWPARSSRRASAARPCTGWRAPAGRCARNGQTRAAASRYCSPPVRWRRSPRCWASACISSPPRPNRSATARPGQARPRYMPAGQPWPSLPGRTQISRSCMSSIWRSITSRRYSA
jgi:SAM-dependent methyltransferase